MDNGHACHFETKIFCGLFQPRLKARKVEDSSKAPEAVDLSPGSQDEIEEHHAVAV